MAQRRVHLIVHGRVQGVWFRASVEREAKRHGVRGFVRNLTDGTVEAVIEGDDRSVAEVVAFCHRGPDGARVDRVDAEDEPPTGEPPSFEVRG